MKRAHFSGAQHEVAACRRLVGWSSCELRGRPSGFKLVLLGEFEPIVLDQKQVLSIKDPSRAEHCERFEGSVRERWRPLGNVRA